MGAKIAAAPRNPLGLVYLSWKEGRGSMIHLWKDPDTGSYGLRRQPEKVTSGSRSGRPKAIKTHGTMVVLLGKKSGEKYD